MKSIKQCGYFKIGSRLIWPKISYIKTPSSIDYFYIFKIKHFIIELRLPYYRGLRSPIIIMNINKLKH